MKILVVGDIVGEVGRLMVSRFVPTLRKLHGFDIVVANGENMAGGFGITPTTVLELYQSGVDVITGGNHTMDKKEGLEILNEDAYCLRPANYPPGTPGKGHVVYTTSSGKKLGVMNLMARTFMDPLDCPFRMAETLVTELRKSTACILLDFHGEATSEKVAMGHHLDGKVSAVVGTHTHVPSGDERILPGGTAFTCDLGMTGPYDSVIGIKKEIIVDRFLTKRGKKFEVATGDPWLCGVKIEIDEESGQAQSIERVRIEMNRPQTHPSKA